MRGPSKPSSKIHWTAYGSGENIYLDFYQKWVSPVKGENTCPMYPACSQYAKIVFQRLPWYEAYFRSLERLLRCGNELHLYPPMRINGEIHWYDPVETENVIDEAEIE
jgi:putative component of membrane protein insertase Oxa1/YidC/SpoIIIJ protein YidD